MNFAEVEDLLVLVRNDGLGCRVEVSRFSQEDCTTARSQVSVYTFESEDITLTFLALPAEYQNEEERVQRSAAGRSEEVEGPVLLLREVRCYEGCAKSPQACITQWSQRIWPLAGR